MKLKAIIYDWDGTIIDSSKSKSLHRLEGVVARYGYAFDADAHKRIDEAWGQPGAAFVSYVLGIGTEEAGQIYHDWDMLGITEPFNFVEGTIEALQLLHDSGFRQCVVSSRNRPTLVPYLRKAAVFDTFIRITCGDDIPHHKPDKRVFDPLLTDLAWHGIAKGECVFVGDTSQDIRAARAAGIRIVVVETGPYRDSHFQTDPVAEEDIIPSVASLPIWIARHYPD